MRPPISSTRRFEIVSPNPEPPNLRVVDELACVNRSNTWLNFSPGMPMPVSETVNRKAVGMEESLIWRDTQGYFAGLRELDRVAKQVKQHLT